MGLGLEVVRGASDGRGKLIVMAGVSRGKLIVMVGVSGGGVIHRQGH